MQAAFSLRSSGKHWMPSDVWNLLKQPVLIQQSSKSKDLSKSRDLERRKTGIAPVFAYVLMFALRSWDTSFYQKLSDRNQASNWNKYLRKLNSCGESAPKSCTTF